MINKRFNAISVDAGLILICDKSFYERGAINKTICRKFKLKNGTYNVSWVIPKSWNGQVEGIGNLKVTSGEVVVSDPCYHFHGGCGHGDDIWGTILNETEFFEKPSDEYTVLDKMGGDGSYTVYANFDRIGD